MLLMLTGTAWSCIVTPSFTYTVSHSCGLPNIVNASNTSSGTFTTGSRYWWKIGSAPASDTITGKSSATLYVKYPGTIAIKLFVKDSAGCIDSTSSSLSVTSGAKSVLDQNFNYSYTPLWMNCLQFISDPDTFRIEIKSADTLKSLRILWGDGTVDTPATTLNPNTGKSHLYQKLGIFNVKIITTNGTCVDTVYGTVYNQRQPTAGIIGPPSGSNRGCVPHTLRIINNSYNISDNTTFRLDWGNGETETLPYTAFDDTIYHTYRSGKGVCAGIIKITASNVCGSSFTTWNPIDISDKDKANWSVAETCNPSGNFVFTNNTADNYCLFPDIKEYFWDFGDSSTFGWTNSKASQAHNYKKEGDYQVTLIAKTACGNDTFKKSVSVFYNPVAKFNISNSRGCKPLSVTLTDVSKGRDNTRTWTVKDGSATKTFTDSILNYTFTSPGNNTVTLSVSNKCNSSSITKTFVVNDKPTAGFANIANTCAPAKISFSNTSVSYFSNPSYTWDFGDGSKSSLKNPSSKTFNTPGTYKVKLLVSDSCGRDSIEKTFTVYSLPVANLVGDTSGCTFDSLTLFNRSGNASSYAWDFGNGYSTSSSDTGKMRVAYSVQGSYKIRLIASNGPGCKDTAELPVILRPGAKSQFTVNKIYACNPTTFKFTNTSVYAKDYKWYANGSLISSSFNLPDTLLNNDSTVVRVKLVTTSNSACQSDSSVITIFTPKNPQAAIANRDSGCGPLRVNFSNSSSFSYSWQWTSGLTGQNSNLKNPAFIYPSAASTDTVYSVKLISANWAGCKDSASTVIKVFPVPTSSFNANVYNGCGPLNVQFSNQSKTNNALPFSSLKHFWNFGNGDTSSLVSPASVFVSNKIKDTVFAVILKTTSANNCSSRDTHNIRVYPQPMISFVPDVSSGCELLKVNFSNYSKPGDTGSINIMKFAWNSGNGSLSDKNNFSSTYRASLYGDTVYQVVLKAWTEHSCYDSLSKNITVHPQPVANFTLTTDNGCTPLKVRTINQSYSPDGKPLSHDWSFGNAYRSSSVNDSSVYINNSNLDQKFQIRYIAITPYNCKDTSTDEITVRPKPKVRFAVNSNKMCGPALLKVSDSSINDLKHYWSEGSQYSEGNKSDTLLLKGLFLFDSTYTISHYVESVHGCFSDTVTQRVQVVGKPQADFVFSNDSSCTDERLYLTNLSLGSVKYNWKFGDGTTGNQINPLHRYPASQIANNDTTFYTLLEAVSSYGCKDTIIKDVTLINKPSEKIATDQLIGCTDLSVQFINPSSRFRTVKWDFGDQTSLVGEDTARHTFVNNTGNLTFSPRIMLIRSRYNCIDTSYQSVNVYPKPTANFRALRTDPCNDGTYQFSNLSLNYSNADWFVDNQFVSSAGVFNMKLPGSAFRDTFYNAKIAITNKYGCTDTAEQNIKVKARMKIAFDKTPAISCEDALVEFTNRSTNSIRYFWKFGDGAVSNDRNPTHAYNQFGNYQIKLFGYDKDGCVDSSDNNTFCKVLERPKADFTYNPAVPQLPNAVVNFFAKPGILSANVDDLVYDWNFGDKSYPTANKNQKNPLHEYFNAGAIAVKLVISNQGCTDSIEKILYVEYAKPVVSFDIDTSEGCEPLRVKFSNNSQFGTSYRWVFGDGTPDGTEKEPVHVYELPGTFDVTLIVVGPGGTSFIKKKALINTFPRPHLDFIVNKRFQTLPNVVFNFINNSSSVFNQWDLIDSTGVIVQSSKQREPSFLVNQMGLYDVRLIGTNSYGCSDTLIKPDYIGTISQGYVYVPDAFSPNKNNKNDGFAPSLYNVKERNYTFRVFNRWGEKLFETTDINAFWDGTFKGETCEQEVYVWTINGEYNNNDLFAFRGTVSLLR